MSNETAIPLDIDHSCEKHGPYQRISHASWVTREVKTYSENGGREEKCPACCYLRGWKDGREKG